MQRFVVGTFVENFTRRIGMKQSKLIMFVCLTKLKRVKT